MKRLRQSDERKKIRQELTDGNESQGRYATLRWNSQLANVDGVEDFHAFDRVTDDFLGKLLVVEARDHAPHQEHLTVLLDL